MKPLARLLAVAAIGALALAACNSEPAPSDTVASDAAPVGSVGTPRAARPAPALLDSGTIGGDGSALRLDPLMQADFSAFELDGELACSFTATDDTAPLLVAKGFAGTPGSRASGVIRFAGRATRIGSLEDGGFDAIVDAGRFAAPGLVVDIRRAAAPVAGSAGEKSPAYPAAMKAMRVDGAARSFDGTWSCGP